MAFSGATHGVTTETVNRFLIDAGGIYKNYGLADEEQLGATRGGNTFAVEQEVREMEIDGIPGPIKGGRRITAVRPRIEANVLEIGVETLLLSLVGSSSESIIQGAGTTATHTRIYRDKNISLADYVDNVAIVGRVLGTEERAIFIVKNVMQIENLEIGMSDEDEGVVTLNLQGSYDPATLSQTGEDEEPWEIRWPKEAVA